MNAKQADQFTRTVDPHMREETDWGLIRWKAGQQIFCPNCQGILDANSTVIATLLATNAQGEEIEVQSWLQCGRCFEKLKGAFYRSVNKLAEDRPELQPRVELLDGRTFTRAGRRRKVRAK